MEEKKDDEEISLDFSKIKKFFNRKAGQKVGAPVEAIQREEQGHKREHYNEYKAESPSSGHKKDDDEISIDFSRIKGIFKTKKSHESPEKKDDDEISIDFSKIKNIFKSSGREHSDDNLSVDIKKISSFFMKNRTFFLLLIPIMLSIFLRVQPAYLPITDQWATDSVINGIRSQISGQINQQYPNLPQQNKDALIETELQKVFSEQKSQIDNQIFQTSNAFKSRLQDDSGQTYLLAIDPYFWLRHAQNIVDNGHPGDEIKNNLKWDNHMFAPGGREVPRDIFHAYFIAFLYKIVSFFNRDAGLMAVSFYVPVLISAISVIPAFFITRKIAGNFGGFIAAIIVAMHSSFLTRTAGGFSDTDAYNVMFPLFIAWLFLEALESKSLKNNIILSVTGGILVGLYSFTWGGWWYIFDFVLVSTISYIAYYSFVHRKELGNFLEFAKKRAIKNSLVFFAVFFLTSAVSTAMLVDFGEFTNFYQNPGGFARLKEVGITSIWPNVYTTVAEQNPASLNNVINQVGLGKFYFFLIALMGITLTLTRKTHKKLWFVIGTFAWYLIVFLMKIQDLNTFLILISIPIVIRILIALWESDTDIDIKYAIFLILWFIATIFASTKGIRFTLLLVPAFAIGFGIALGELYYYASSWTSRFLKINRIVSKATVMTALVLVLVAPYNSASNVAKNEIPSFNDAWRISLENIKADSQPNAIINSWWDFGHWFKYWADRGVTFDGTSQNTPQAHWIGKVLLTDDEDLAMGILRTLDCSGYTGGTRAYRALFELTKDEVEAINILYEVMPESKESAKKILIGHFSGQDVDEILELTHCGPPENYFITSEDMVGKSGVWAHFGSWDFNRGLIYNTLKRKEYANNREKGVQFLRQRFDYSDQEAEDIYFEVRGITSSDQANNWIAPWPGYAGSGGCSTVENQTISCNVAGIPLVFDLDKQEGYAESQGGRLYPKLISFPTNIGIILKEYNQSTITLQNNRQLGIALIKNGDSYQAIAMDSDLTGSMFTRMFYQEGIGLKYFKKFDDQSSVFGGRIIVWKVDWEGSETTAIQEPVQEIEKETEIFENQENKTVENSTESNQTDNSQ
jgi:dolichyl-phosphooligosaccharide-protein glycotransferase